MNSLVIYASRSGNTQRVAETIAEALGAHGSVRLLAVEEAPTTLPAGLDLLVIGGPTEGHHMTAPMAEYLHGLVAGSVSGVTAAAFDTRLRWPRWLSGSAAGDIAERLVALGAHVLEPAASFIVTMKPELAPGELERAAAWAKALPDLAAPSSRVPAGVA